MKIMNMDAIIALKSIPDHSIDFILCDPPYGTTGCSWDKSLDFKKVWVELNRCLKPYRSIALFGSEPFSTKLKCSNLEDYKYDWYWVKPKANGFQQAKNKPMAAVETISLFSKGSINHASLSDKRMLYNPVGIIPTGYKKVKESSHSGKTMGSKEKGKSSRPNQVGKEYMAYTGFPSTVLHYPQVLKGDHPTQKPVELLRFLIESYSNPGDTVLDFTMGSGSTGVAAISSGRDFIGIELNEEYYGIAKRKLELL